MSDVTDLLKRILDCAQSLDNTFATIIGITNGQGAKMVELEHNNEALAGVFHTLGNRLTYNEEIVQQLVGKETYTKAVARVAENMKKGTPADNRVEQLTDQVKDLIELVQNQDAAIAQLQDGMHPSADVPLKVIDDPPVGEDEENALGEPEEDDDENTP